MKDKLNFIYKRLYSSFGPQHWWPAEGAFEVMVGAVLTQNTSWLNVEKAIINLKKNNLLTPTKLYNLKDTRLASLIRPAGYFNIKTKRLKSFLRAFIKTYQARHRKMRLADTLKLRQWLLSINGIGPETADSILLYALGKPIFVVDAYTKRILSRHGIISADAAYEEVQDLFMQNLRQETSLFNEYHALLVKLGKDFCLKNKPRCLSCPLYDGKTRDY